MKELGKLMAKVWEDPQLKAKLKADPKGVLAEYGVAVPAGLNLEVLECTKDTTYIVLPPTGTATGMKPLEKLPDSYGYGAVAKVVLTKAEKDATFRKLALSDPMAAMIQIGVELAPGHSVKIVEATPTKNFLVIPQPPKTELSLEELDKVAGGKKKKGSVSTSEAEVQTSTSTTTVEAEAEAAVAVGSQVFLT